MKVEDYKIVSQKRIINSLYEFECEIRGMIKDGWQPLGPPHIVGGDLHIQAMVKPVNKKSGLERFGILDTKASPD